MISSATVTRSFRRTLAALIATSAVSSMAFADTVVTPNAFAGTVGTSALNTLLRDLNQPRSYQMLIDDGQLASIPVGSLITGVQWRPQGPPGSNPPTWPAADYTYNDYNMWIGPAALPVGSMSTTFANNVGPGELQVLDGPLMIPAGSFVNNGVAGVPNPFGFLINFDVPYIYTGGDLAFTARHPGANSVGTIFLDGIPQGATSWANGVQAISATGDAAATGAAVASVIMQFTYTVPAPSALALLGLGFLGTGRRRRS